MGITEDVEFDIAHHPAKRTDLRLNGDELGIHAFDGNGAVADSRCMRMLSDGNLERDFSGQHPLLEWFVAGDGISAWRIVSMG